MKRTQNLKRGQVHKRYNSDRELTDSDDTTKMYNTTEESLNIINSLEDDIQGSIKSENNNEYQDTDFDAKK